MKNSLQKLKEKKTIKYFLTCDRGQYYYPNIVNPNFLITSEILASPYISLENYSNYI